MGSSFDVSQKKQLPQKVPPIEMSYFYRACKLNATILLPKLNIRRMSSIISPSKENLFVEKVSNGATFSIRKDKILASEKSQFQDIEIFENATYGTVLTLDGVCQVTLKDEHIYHE